MSEFRTDLALEICRDLKRNHSTLDGIECTVEKIGPLTVDRVHILTDEASALCEKPKGEYVTVSTGKLWLDDRDTFRDKVLSFAELLKPYLDVKERKSILVAGLGNRSITADAIGPVAVKNLIVTRHIRTERPAIFEELGLVDLCAFTPGVLGQTGIESADMVRSIVDAVKPQLLVVIDALASRDPERLVTTVQIGNSGLQPGSGIGNTRPSLSPEELNIPVLSIGVPTVVDAATLAADAIRRFSGIPFDAATIREEWKKSELNFFVTPKETDQIIHVMGSFLAYGINLALNEKISFEDMLSLVG